MPHHASRGASRAASGAVRIVLLLAALCGAPPVGFSQSQATATPRFNPRDTTPFDQAIHTATLPNGLRYFVRKNARPEKRVALRLVVKAGSLEETDDQQGLAHFLEH